MVKSTSHLRPLGPTHPGRPENEEPHVKKTMKGKVENIDLICRIDQVQISWYILDLGISINVKDELGYLEDEFDDLKELFKVTSSDIW